MSRSDKVKEGHQSDFSRGLLLDDQSFTDDVRGDPSRDVLNVPACTDVLHRNDVVTDLIVSGSRSEQGLVNTPGIVSLTGGAISDLSGCVSAVMEGPAHSDVNIVDHVTEEKASCDIHYLATQPGEYRLSVTLDDEHISDSPLSIHIAPPTSSEETNQERRIFTTPRDHYHVSKPVSLVVWTPSERGSPVASLVSPSGATLQAFVQEVDEDCYVVRFIPRENGRYIVNVSQNDQPVSCSPLTVAVGKAGARAALVTASGQGLVKGQEGIENDFSISSLTAGSDDIHVLIEGPSKAKLTYQQQTKPDSYLIKYVTGSSGTYKVNIKYSGQHHIPGSPFSVPIQGQGKAALWNEQAKIIIPAVVDFHRPIRSEQTASAEPISDSDRIVCMGAGLKRAFVNRPATFAADTTLAIGDLSQSSLYIGVTGPEGSCPITLTRHYPPTILSQVQQDQQQEQEEDWWGVYTVAYTATQRGSHCIVVLLGDTPANGSPFHVTVL